MATAVGSFVATGGNIGARLAEALRFARFLLRAKARRGERLFAPRFLCFIRAMRKTLLSFVDDLYEDLELWYPRLRLEEAGCAMRVAALELKTFKGKHG